MYDTTETRLWSQRLNVIASLRQGGDHFQAAKLASIAHNQLPLYAAPKRNEKGSTLPVVKADLTRHTGGKKGTPAGCGKPSTQPAEAYPTVVLEAIRDPDRHPAMGIREYLKAERREAYYTGSGQA